MKALILIGVLLVASASAYAQATKPGTYFVKEAVLQVRLGPSATAPVTNRIYRGQKVEVFEVKSGWVRVSKFYDGFVEGQSGKVARWFLQLGYRLQLLRSCPSRRCLVIPVSPKALFRK